jgi:Predicted acetyltransferase
MDFVYNNTLYFDAILNIAYEKYCAELACHTFLKGKNKPNFCSFLKQQFMDMDCIAAIENDICIGFILFSLQDRGDEKTCTIPVWGYGANHEKTMSFLFTKLAERIVTDKTTYFSVRLYAHDKEIQKLFSYMQFGIMCEKTVRKISKIPLNRNIEIRKIAKDELIHRWDAIWLLISQLIDHLRRSPVFYPCKEFTENVYKEFFTEDSTAVYIAEDKNKIVGLIEANSENYDYVFDEQASANVGEAFVIPEYRGKQIAQALLSCLENDLLNRHIDYDWVEHGTANPNARGFWNKYFETVEYEFIRKIEV